MLAFGTKQIFDTERNAFQRASIAGSNFLITHFSLRFGKIRRHVYIRVDFVIGAFDCAQIGIGQFNGTEFFVGKSCAGVCDGEFGKIGHF